MTFTPLMTLILDASDHQPLRRIARETGTDHTRLRRMGVGETPWNPTVVVALSRRYRVPIGTAFVAAGWISEAEATAMKPSLSIRTIPHVELLDEVVRRITAGEIARVMPRPPRRDAEQPATEVAAHDAAVSPAGREVSDPDAEEAPPSLGDVEPQPFSGELATIAQLVQQVAHAETQLADLISDRNRRIRQAKNNGVSSRAIGDVLGVSQQRIANILAGR